MFKYLCASTMVCSILEALQYGLMEKKCYSIVCLLWYMNLLFSCASMYELKQQMLAFFLFWESVL